jgi:hypothetical protein
LPLIVRGQQRCIAESTSAKFTICVRLGLDPKQQYEGAWPTEDDVLTGMWDGAQPKVDCSDEVAEPAEIGIADTGLCEDD